MSAEVIIEFDRECLKCYGTSEWMPDKQCEQCNNTGRIATTLGHDLLEFLRRQGIKPATDEQRAKEL